jgi:hypothetical protein
MWDDKQNSRMFEKKKELYMHIYTCTYSILILKPSRWFYKLMDWSKNGVVFCGGHVCVTIKQYFCV